MEVQDAAPVPAPVPVPVPVQASQDPVPVPVPVHSPVSAQQLDSSPKDGSDNSSATPAPDSAPDSAPTTAPDSAPTTAPDSAPDSAPAAAPDSAPTALQQGEPSQASEGCEQKELEEGQEIYIQTEGLTVQMAEPGLDRIVIVNGPDGTTMHIQTPEGVPLEAVQALLGIETADEAKAPQ